MNTQKKKKDTQKPVFAFDKQNYILMIVGFVIIVLGYILMSGGAADDPAVFSDAIFNFRRITLAPILIVIGFGIEIYAILKKPTSKEMSENSEQ
ncbi:MAG: DUF3098 domain-containing protein [Bacteroidales bacterium]|jgi:uncharacterized membrane protein|nr:DUF3098 domain-containing protein [Bacteroidales bacterium]